MGDNSRKTPMALSLNDWATSRIADAIQLRGKALPCQVEAVSGSIVTVSFQVQSDFTLPQVEMPVLGPEYIRLPIQVGDKGVCMACDARIGNVTGLGPPGAPSLNAPANLAALVFVPVGNTNWFSVDGQSLVLYGPGGVVIMDQQQQCVIQLTPDGITITMPSGGGDLTINANGGTVQVNDGDVLADTISLKHHTHDGVTTGSGDTGEPNP